jgi:hypothetical protein
MKMRWRGHEVLAFAIIVGALWAVRGSALDRFVTIDEPRWLARSANFYQAVVAKDFAQTTQAPHPGVMTMWAGAIGFHLDYPDYGRDGVGQLEGLRSVEPILRRRGVDPLQVLTAARAVLVFFIVLALATAYLAAKRLLGWIPATVGFLFIAFDPFQIALSRVLHVDAIMAALIFTSLLFLYRYLFLEGKWRDLLISGGFAGLAFLSKSPALILAPFTALLLFFQALKIRDVRSGAALRGFISACLLWGLPAVTVTALFWPAMWVKPITTAYEVLRGAFGQASSGHANPIFFLGEVWIGDPGRLFYPITYLWRTTPATLLGLVLVIGAYGLRLPPLDRKPMRGVVLASVLFAIMYTAFVSLGAKKFDRYLLPVYAPLSLISALGWFAWIQAIPRLLVRFKGHRILSVRWVGWMPGALIYIVVGIQLAGALCTWPYYFSYFNPLLGGPEKAIEVMQVGWGEGLDEAARYLNGKSDADSIKAMAWYASGPFDYFFEGQSSTLNFDREDLEDIPNYDYVILYAHQWQRQLPTPAFLDYFEEQNPEAVVTIDGIDYAWIYWVRR